MKTFKFLLLTLLVIQLSACSNNDFNELVEHGKIQNSSIDTIQIDDEFDVYSYVEEHSELFIAGVSFKKKK